jgi:prefoldin subunit 5
MSDTKTKKVENSPIKLDKLADLFKGLEQINDSINNTNPEVEELITEIDNINKSIEALKTLNTTLIEKGEADKAELVKIDATLNDMKKKIETTTQNTNKIKSSLEGIQTTGIQSTGTKTSTSNSSTISKSVIKPTYTFDEPIFKGTATPKIEDVFKYFNKSKKYDDIKDFNDKPATISEDKKNLAKELIEEIKGPFKTAAITEFTQKSKLNNPAVDAAARYTNMTKLILEKLAQFLKIPTKNPKSGGKKIYLSKMIKYISTIIPSTRKTQKKRQRVKH